MKMEKRERTKLAHQLRQNGIPLNVDDACQDSVLRMRLVGEPSDSRAFDLGNHATGYIINVNVYITSSNISISDICLELPWEDHSISLLSDPLEIGARYGNYRFCGKKPFEIERTRVLNHRLVRPGLLSRRVAFQGLLLWNGMAEIPDAFVHAGDLPATIIFYDQFEDSHAFPVTLWIDRRMKWSPENRKGRTRAPLLSQRDASPS